MTSAGRDVAAAHSMTGSDDVVVALDPDGHRLRVFAPTAWDWLFLAGSIATFAWLFLLFVRVLPAISIAGVFLRGAENMERRPIDWRILGGGIVFGVIVVVLGIGGIPFSQEIIFVISMGVVCTMLVLVTVELDHNTRMGIMFSTIIVFAFRAAPTVGDGFFWWTLDELNFDAAFYGTLRQ